MMILILNYSINNFKRTQHLYIAYICIYIISPSVSPELPLSFPAFGLSAISALSLDIICTSKSKYACKLMMYVMYAIYYDIIFI